MDCFFDKIGVQLYDLLRDGCLNGSYINTDTGQIFNEMAKKKDGSEGILGEYFFTYSNQESGAKINICSGTLSVSPGINNKALVSK